MKSARATSGTDEVRGEAVESVAGGSRYGNEVEVVAVRTSGRPKRTVKRREILDPFFVSKRSINRY